MDRLQKILEYHIIPDHHFIVAAFVPGLRIETLHGDKQLRIEEERDVIHGIGSDARIVTGDIRGGESIMHIIDDVLLPFDLADIKDRDNGSELDEDEIPNNSYEDMSPLLDDPEGNTDIDEDKEDDEEDYGRIYPHSVIEIVSSTPSLYLLMDVFRAAHLDVFLDNPALEGTLLAPSNEAFLELLDKLAVASIEDVDSKTLSDIIGYHLVPGRVPSEKLYDKSSLKTFDVVNRQVSEIDRVLIRREKSDDDDIITFEGVGSSARLIESDIAVGKSVIHIIDTVLLPYDIRE